MLKMYTEVQSDEIESDIEMPDQGSDFCAKEKLIFGPKQPGRDMKSPLAGAGPKTILFPCRDFSQKDEGGRTAMESFSGKAIQETLAALLG